VITVPRGGKIPFRTIRAEFMYEPSETSSTMSFFGVGLTNVIDVEVVNDSLRNDKSFTSLDLNFNLSAPFAGVSPGISFGLLDAANNSPLGRRGYVAVSLQDSKNSSPLASASATEFTMGAYFGRSSHLFVGLSLPVNDNFRFLAEDDGFRVAGGAEFKFENGPFFRAVFRQNQTLVSLGMSAHF
jgi:hypothetical protein